MTNSRQHRGWICWICQQAATAVLVLAFVLGPAVIATPSAQAQTFTVLYWFKGLQDDGINPEAGLVRDKAGNLYGTTGHGGDGTNFGTVFKLDTTGKETLLHSFAGGATDGQNPYAGLVRDKTGNLYGTTSFGGASGIGLGLGTVFKLDTTGKETLLYSFAGGATDGQSPQAGLIRDNAGNLYGTTVLGGASGLGTVFKLDTTGKETALHSFTGRPRDGAIPLAGLIQDAAGNLYGTTVSGGLLGLGTVFKLTP